MTETDQYGQNEYLTPSTTLDLEAKNTQPAYREIDLNKYDGKTPEQVLNILTRDIRLGNIRVKYHDVDWLWRRLDLAQQLLLIRGQGFRTAAISCLSTVASIVETGLAIDGFLRKVPRTVRHQEYSSSDDSGRGGLFGKKKRKRDDTI